MRWSSPAILAILCTAVWAADGTPLSQFDDTWKAERWNKSTGTLASTPDGPHAPLPQGTITVSFKGTGFEGFVINPATPLAVPKTANTISMWTKGGGPGYPICVKFQDATGNKKAGNIDLEWNILDVGGDTWKQQTFTIPATWARPVTIYAIAVHNWNHQTEAAKMTYHLSELTTTP